MGQGELRILTRLAAGRQGIEGLPEGRISNGVIVQVKAGLMTLAEQLDQRIRRNRKAPVGSGRLEIRLKQGSLPILNHSIADNLDRGNLEML
jgi:hypothetical protein